MTFTVLLFFFSLFCHNSYYNPSVIDIFRMLFTKNYDYVSNKYFLQSIIELINNNLLCSERNKMQ